MSIVAQSSDGTQHEFPDGTAGTVIDKVMKDYASSKAPESTLTDVAKSSLTGLAKFGTGLAGLPGDASDLLDKGANALTGASISTRTPISMPNSQQVGDAVSSPFGGFHTPQTTLGKYAETISEFVPAALAPGTVAARMGRVLLPGAGSEAAGEATEGTKYETAARVAGALLGGASPKLVSSAKSGLADLLLGPKGNANPNLLDLGNKAEQLGINIRPAQLSPSPFIKTADDQLSRLPYTGYSDSGARVSTEAQQQQFTKALANTFGANADALTPDVMASAKKNIGDMFNGGLKGITISPTKDTADALGAVKDQIDNVSPALADSDVTRLNRTFDKINGLIKDGMSADHYQQIRQKGGLLSGLSEDANPTIAGIGRDLRETLDDAFQSQAPGPKAAQISKARQLYRNFKTVEPLADKAPLGNISPPLLLGQVNKTYQDLSKSGDIGDLGRIGQALLKTPPNSNTAERSIVMSLLKNPLTATGQILALPLEATLGRGMSAAINSKAYKARLMGDALKNAGKK